MAPTITQFARMLTKHYLPDTLRGASSLLVLPVC